MSLFIRILTEVHRSELTRCLGLALKALTKKRFKGRSPLEAEAATS